jgi:putative membrane protein
VLVGSPVSEILKAFPEALMHHLRNEPYRLHDVPGFEHERNHATHTPLYLAQRLYATLAEWSRNSHIDQSMLRILDGHARGLMNVLGVCEKIRATPLSPSYKALLRTGLFLHVLVAPWLLVPEGGLWSLPVVLLIGC